MPSLGLICVTKKATTFFLSNITIPNSINMAKVLSVFGATGKQGISVVNHVLADPELAKQFGVRAITRNVDSTTAKQLAKNGVEVVHGDFKDPVSIEKAVAGSHTVYLMTTPSFGTDAVEAEYNTAKLVADISVQNGVKYIIFSTLPSVSKLSGGRYNNVTAFDAKEKAEQYIRTLPIQSAFCSLGSFMQNFADQPFLAPKPGPHNTWILRRPVPSTAKLPLLDAIEDTGKFVGAILADPVQYSGQTIHAAEQMYSYDDIVAALSKSCGKSIVFKQVSEECFRETLPILPDLWMDGFRSQEEFGYFGPNSEALVASGAKLARGTLTTLEKFLELHPFHLA